MSKILERDTEKTKAVVRLNKNSKVYKTIINALKEKKAENILSLDLRKIPEAVSDFFIVCQAGSTTQLKAIADHVEDEMKLKCGENFHRHEGRQGLQWILVDYVNIVVHIMMPDARKFYRLEEMWSDAVVTAHSEE